LADEGGWRGERELHRFVERHLLALFDGRGEGGREVVGASADRLLVERLVWAGNRPAALAFDRCGRTPEAAGVLAGPDAARALARPARQ
jgi:hypothetical protein